MHDGYAILIDEGVKHKLKPLQVVMEKLCSSARFCLVDDMVGEKQEHVCFAKTKQ